MRLPDWKNKKIEKKFFGKILAGFFLLMILCTVISRAADSVTIPKVKTDTKKSKKLSFSLEGKGEISAAKQFSQLAPKGVVPEECAASGTKLKKGDRVVKFLMEDLEKKKTLKTEELKKLELQLEQARLSAAADARVPAAYGAGRELDRAKRNKASCSTDYEKAKEKYEAEKKRPEADKAKLEELKAAAEAGKEKLDQAKEAVESAQNAYTLAEKEDAAAAQNAGKAEKNASYTAKGLEVDITGKKREIKELEQLIKDKGELRANRGGILLKTGVTEGQETSGTELIQIGTGDFEFHALISGEDQEKIAIGDELNIKVPGNEDKIQAAVARIEMGNNAKADSGQDSAEGNEGEAREDVLEAVCSLPDGDYMPGGLASFSMEKETEDNYESVLPLSAIRKDNQGYYCLAVETRGGILGEESVAVRIDLRIKAKDDYSAAVTGALEGKTEIIMESSKNVEEGDRVRIER